MKTTLTFALAAPLALALSACGGADNADAPDAAANADTATAATAIDYPAVPENARTAVQYSGTYEQKQADGSKVAITLGADDSFTMIGADGAETMGTFNWYSDNSRMLIKNGDQNMVFAVADGYLYQLADKDAPAAGERSAETTYTKAAAQ